MVTVGIEIIRRTENQVSSESNILEWMAREGLVPYRWSNRPGDKYSPHTHNYNKVIYVVEGSIMFKLPASGEQVELFAGDRLNLPAQVLHGAVVGSKGVVCLEAHY